MRAMWLAILLAGCATAAPLVVPPSYPPDRWGYVYPAECRHDLSAIPVPVRYVPREKLVDIGKGILNPVGLIGVCWHCAWFDGSAAIYIADDLALDDKLAAVHHERCHRAFWLATGSVDWHK